MIGSEAVALPLCLDTHEAFSMTTIGNLSWWNKLLSVSDLRGATWGHTEPGGSWPRPSPLNPLRSLFKTHPVHRSQFLFVNLWMDLKQELKAAGKQVVQDIAGASVVRCPWWDGAFGWVESGVGNGSMVRCMSCSNRLLVDRLIRICKSVRNFY